MKNIIDKIHQGAVDLLSRPQAVFALCVFSGVVLLACIAPSEYLFVPQSIETPARYLYRAAYFVVLPFRGIVIPFLPAVHHHWSPVHTTVVCFGAPFFYWGLYRAFMFLRRRWRPLAFIWPTKQSGPQLNRRRFLVTSAAGCTGVVFGGTGASATLIEPQRLQVRRYTLPIRGLPADLDGLSIAHVSDTHYGPFIALSYLEWVIERVNDLKPDVVLLTGDYAHRSNRAIEPGVEIFAALKSRFGAVAVLGNHDHWVGVERARHAFKDIGVPTIDNRRVYLDGAGFHETPRSKYSLCVAGVGDLWEKDVRIEDALDGVPEGMPRLLLSHNPDVAETLNPKYRVDLMFSGHTHGGQVRFPLVGPVASATRYGRKYLGGLCEGPHCPVIVSRGVGLGGIPMRFRVEPEIGYVRLIRA